MQHSIKILLICLVTCNIVFSLPPQSDEIILREVLPNKKKKNLIEVLEWLEKDENKKRLPNLPLYPLRGGYKEAMINDLAFKENAIELYKMWGHTLCLSASAIYIREGSSVQNELKALNFSRSINKKILDEIQVYVYASTLGQSSLWWQCLKLYESKEYNAEVERIVKKYCKECE